MDIRIGSVGPKETGDPAAARSSAPAERVEAAYDAAHREALQRAASAPRRGDPGGMASDMPPPTAGEHARLRWAAEQLESLLIYEMLKSARGTVMKTGLLDSQATKMFEDMLDEERASQMARSGGMGLAELIYEQMSRHLPPEDEDEGKQRK